MNVVGCVDIFCGFFYFLFLLLYLNCFFEGMIKDSSKRLVKYLWFWFVFFIFWCVLLLFSKENGIIVFGVCVVYDVIFVCKFSGKYLFRLLLYWFMVYFR